MRLKPLHGLVKNVYRKPISHKAWTPELRTLFADLKICITSSPVLARFDPSKITFMKIDWSSEGTGWIIMHPADDNESGKATTHLRAIRECSFELSKNGARLKVIAFDSCSCNNNERNFRSFTSEGACGCWAIEKTKIPVELPLLLNV